MPTRAEFVAEARSWLDVRWRHEGRDRHGLDCAGLLIVTAWGLGVSEFDVRGYGKRPSSPNEFVSHFIRAGCALKPHRDLLLGDLIITRLERYPFHCGIYTGGPGEGRILHAYARSPWRRVVEMPFSGELRAGWTHCLRVPGLSD